jgi:hypothetical protein
MSVDLIQFQQDMGARLQGFQIWQLADFRSA